MLNTGGRYITLRMMRFVAVLLVVVFAVAYVPATAAAEELSYRFKYADPESTILTGYTGTLPEVLQIPASVTTIAERAFAGNNTIVQVVATPRTTRVENSAFNSCRSLQRVQFPRIQYIGASAFEYCESLTVASVGDELQKIDEYAFRYCKSLKDIVFPDSLTVIESGAFNKCESLETITIPDSVIQLGPDRVYGSGWFLETGVFARSGLKTAYLGSGLTALTSGLFEGCHLLEEVQMGPNIKTIGASTFSYCSALNSIAFPDSIVSIGREAFMGAGLTNLLLPDNARVSDEAFWECNKLQYVYIPADLEFVDNEPSNAGSFYGCTSLKRVLYGGSAYQWDQLGLYYVEQVGAKVIFEAERPDPKPPQIETQPASHAVEEGSSTDLDVRASVYNAFTGDPEQVLYQWQVDNGNGLWENIPASNWNYAGSQTHRLTIMNVSTEMDGWRYRCIATNAADLTKSTASEAATIVLITPEPTPTPRPSAVPSFPTSPSLTIGPVDPGSSVTLGMADPMLPEGGSYRLIPLNGGPDLELWVSGVLIEFTIPLSAPAGEYEYSLVYSLTGGDYEITVSTLAFVISDSPVGLPTPTLAPTPSPSPTAVPSASERPTSPSEPSPTIGPITSTAPVPSIVPAPTVPAVPGYESGCMSGKFYYVKTAGASTMYYLKNSTGRMVRVSAPYTTSSTGTRYYPVNYSGAMLFPRIADGRISCYCIYADSLEIPVLNVVSAASPTLAGEYQTGMMNGHMYFVKTSGAWTMYYLMSSTGRMTRVSAPYVTDMSGRRCYPINHGGTVLFPKLTDGVLTSYATGSGETVLAIL